MNVSIWKISICVVLSYSVLSCSPDSDQDNEINEAPISDTVNTSNEREDTLSLSQDSVTSFNSTSGDFTFQFNDPADKGKHNGRNNPISQTNSLNRDTASTDIVVEAREYPEKDWMNFLDTFKVEEQLFHLNPGRDTILVCSSGTKIYFAANSFSYSDGKPVLKNFEIVIKECLSAADMIGEKLTTSTTDRDLIETGGMLHIEARENNSILRLRDSARYVMFFPKKEDKPGMQLFYSKIDSNGYKLWRPDTLFKDRTVVKRAGKNSSWNRGTNSQSQAVYRYCELRLDYDGKTISGGPLVSPTTDRESANLLRLFNETLNRNRRLRRDFCECEMTSEMIVTFSSAGNPYGLRFIQNSKREYDSLFADIIKRLPKYTSGDQESFGGAAINIGLSHVDREETKAEVYYFNKKYDEFLFSVIEKVDRAELDNFILVGSNLGWVNCDRFINFKGKKGDVILPALKATAVSAWIIFKEMASILPAQQIDGKLVFKNIPLNVPVKIIAINYETGQPTLASLELINTGGNLTLPEFKAFSLEELHEALGTIYFR